MHLQGQQYVCAGELIALQTMTNVLNIKPYSKTSGDFNPRRPFTLTLLRFASLPATIAYSLRMWSSATTRCYVENPPV